MKLRRLLPSEPARHMLMSSIYFAFMQVGVKLLPNIPAHEIMLFRAVVTLGFCWIWIKRSGVSPWGVNKKSLILRGVSGTLALLLFYTSIQHLPLALVVTLQNLSPIFGLIVSQFFLKESGTPIQWIGCLLAFLGVWIMNGFGDSNANPLYIALAILSPLLASIAYAYVRVLRRTDPPMVVIFYFPLVYFPVSLLLCLIQWKTPTWKELLILLMVGFFTQGGQYHLTRAFQGARMTHVSVYGFAGVIQAVLLGYWIFGEKIALPGLLGIGLIFVAVVLVTFFQAENARNVE